ncbi:hypothetical protein [Mariniblastus fucicola]|nr:hypothetical protein [Mariniblastus fucicola]
MNEANWKAVLLARMTFTFLTVFGGIFAIAAGILKPLRMLLGVGAVAGLIATAFVFYPCGIQYLAGPEVHMGEISQVNIPAEQLIYRMLPESKTVSSERKQLPVQVHLRPGDGKRYIIKAYLRDLKDSGLGTATPNGRWRIVSLPYLERILSAEQASPAHTNP